MSTVAGLGAGVVVNLLTASWSWMLWTGLGAFAVLMTVSQLWLVKLTEPAADAGPGGAGPGRDHNENSGSGSFTVNNH